MTLVSLERIAGILKTHHIEERYAPDELIGRHFRFVFERTIRGNTGMQILFGAILGLGYDTEGDCLCLSVSSARIGVDMVECIVLDDDSANVELRLPGDSIETFHGTFELR